MKNEYSKSLKGISINTTKKNALKVEKIVAYHNDSNIFFTKKERVIFHFIIKGFKLEKISDSKEKDVKSDFFDKIENYLDGRNLDENLISLDSFFSYFQENFFLIPFAVFNDPSKLFIEPEIIGKIYSYFFNRGYESIEDIDEYMSKTTHKIIFKDLSINIEHLNDEDQENHALFILDGSNIARNKTNSLDADIHEIIKCREKLVQLGASFDKIFIFIGAGIRHHINDTQKEELQKLLAEVNISQTPKGENDDNYIIDTAISDNSYIITNDFYSDYIQKHPEHQDFIKKHLIHFTCIGNKFVFKNDDEIRIREIIKSQK